MDRQRQEKSGLATAGMVLGIIGIVMSPLPVINNLAFVLGVLALIFGFVGIMQTKSGKKLGRGKAIAGLVLGICTIAVVLFTQQMFSKAMDDATKTINSTTSSQPSETTPKWDMEAAYAKVANGMTKAQVEAAIGKQSNSCTESQSEYIGKIEICTYGNMITDKATIGVTYSQDKVTNKTKSTY